MEKIQRTVAGNLFCFVVASWENHSYREDQQSGMGWFFQQEALAETHCESYKPNKENAHIGDVHKPSSLQ